MRIVAAFAVASLFSLLYAGLYPILTGSFVLYWYPAWPTSMAGAYVAGGAVLQAWLCTRRAAAPRATWQSRWRWAWDTCS